MSPHGVRGQLKIRWLGDGPENLLRQKAVWLTDEEQAPIGRYEVQDAGRGRTGEVRLTLAGVEDRDQAAALRGCLVEGDISQLEALPEGEFYWHQLIGCTVRGHDGSEIGTVVELLETGAHDVMVVEDSDGVRHLVPTAAELVREMDPARGLIVVERLPGLID